MNSGNEMTSVKLQTQAKTGSPLKGALGAIMGIAAGASFGFGGAVSQILGRQGFSVFNIVAAQFLCGVIIMGILTIFTKRAHFSSKEIIMLVVLGAISTISSVTYYLAIDLLSVSQAVAIQFQYVWMTIVLQLVTEKKKPNVRTLIVVALVLVGTLLGSGLMDEILSGTIKTNMLGVGCALICALFYAIFIFMNGKVAADQPPVARTFVLVCGGFVVSLTVGWSFYLNPAQMGALIPGGILMSIMMSVLPVLCIVGASMRLPSGVVAVLTSTELPAAVLAGIILLGESVTPLVVVGVVLILIGVFMAEGKSEV